MFMRLFLSTLFAILLSFHLEAQEKKMIYKLYKKNGKELNQEQLDSLEAVHKRLNFQYEHTATETIIIVNLINEKNKAPQKRGWTIEMVQQEDGSYKAKIPSEDPLKEKWIGQDIFQADLKDMEGKNHTLGTKTHRLTVLNFWFAGCAPCIREMPDLNKLVAEFRHDKVDFIALTFDSRERVNKFLTKRKFDYHIIPDAQGHMNKVWMKGSDETQDIDALYPVHFVIDQNGIVQEVILGARENIKELLREAIQAQL